MACPSGHDRRARRADRQRPLVEAGRAGSGDRQAQRRRRAPAVAAAARGARPAPGRGGDRRHRRGLRRLQGVRVRRRNRFGTVDGPQWTVGHPAGRHRSDRASGARALLVDLDPGPRAAGVRRVRRADRAGAGRVARCGRDQRAAVSPRRRRRRLGWHAGARARDLLPRGWDADLAHERRRRAYVDRCPARPDRRPAQPDRRPDGRPAGADRGLCQRGPVRLLPRRARPARGRGERRRRADLAPVVGGRRRGPAGPGGRRVSGRDRRRPAPIVPRGRRVAGRRRLRRAGRERPGRVRPPRRRRHLAALLVRALLGHPGRPLRRGVLRADGGGTVRRPPGRLRGLRARGNARGAGRRLLRGGPGAPAPAAPSGRAGDRVRRVPGAARRHSRLRLRRVRRRAVDRVRGGRLGARARPGDRRGRRHVALGPHRGGAERDRHARVRRGVRGVGRRGAGAAVARGSPSPWPPWPRA